MEDLYQLHNGQVFLLARKGFFQERTFDFIRDDENDAIEFCEHRKSETDAIEILALFAQVFKIKDVGLRVGGCF